MGYLSRAQQLLEASSSWHGCLEIDMKKAIEKNVLDLNFQKQLVIASTAVLIAFTYLIV